MELIFLELAAIIVLATVLGFVFKKIKQPELVGFIVAGIILGSLLNIITYQEIVVVFSDIGIAFLLFLVGINLDWRILKDIGKLSLTAGLGQILITAIASFFAARLIGFGVVESLYIGIALTFSSTIVGVKLLSDKNELNSLHGRIALGILLIQDFAAILVLIFISSFSSGSMPLLNQIARFVFSIVVLLGVFYLLSKFVVRPLFDRLAKYPELLFLGSIAWCFALASFALLLGFSKEIGAFIAGITLASIPYSYEISGKLKYLRDFFIVLFFVFLGTRAVFASFDTVVFPAIVLSIFVLIIDPVVVFLLAKKFGYKPRTAFLSATILGQVSEFSLILVTLGESLGHITSQVTSIVTLVTLITMIASSYFIIFGNKLFEFLSKQPFFSFFLKHDAHQERLLNSVKQKKYEIVFLGFNKTGKSIFSQLAVKKEKTMVIDFDPNVVKQCIKEKFHAFYGDVADIETIDLLKGKNPKIVVSTILDYNTSALLLKKLSKEKKVTKVCLAFDLQKAKKLYELGADLVIVPSIVAGKVAGEILSKLLKDKKHLKNLRAEALLHFEGIKSV